LRASSQREELNGLLVEIKGLEPRYTYRPTRDFCFSICCCERCFSKRLQIYNPFL